MRHDRALAVLVLILLAVLPGRVSAQDEPGVAKPGPTSPPGPAPAPTAPAPPPSTLPAPAGVLARGRAACLPESGCPVLAELVPLLADPVQGAAVASLLATSGDERAATPLALTAVYGPPSLRLQAAAALAALARAGAAKQAVLRMAQNDPDPALRRAARLALTGDPEGRVPPPELLVGQPTPPPHVESGIDPDSARVIYGPTAFRRGRHRWNWTIQNLGLWNLDVGITDNLQLGLITAPPAGALAFWPQLRAGGALGEKVEMAVQVGAGAFWPFISNGDNWHAVVYGGGPVLTIGSPKLLFNIGVPVYGVSVGSERYSYGKSPYSYGKEMAYDNHWFVIPNLGFSAQVAKRIKLSLELHTPLGDHDMNGKLWVILYGMRIFGERIYGDISFVIPAYPGADQILKYVPIGFPLLGFGFQWGK
jgi:hypothetical protein